MQEAGIGEFELPDAFTSAYLGFSRLSQFFSRQDRLCLPQLTSFAKQPFAQAGISEGVQEGSRCLLPCILVMCCQSKDGCGRAYATFDHRWKGRQSTAPTRMVDDGTEANLLARLLTMLPHTGRGIKWPGVHARGEWIAALVWGRTARFVPQCAKLQESPQVVCQVRSRRVGAEASGTVRSARRIGSCGARYRSGIPARDELVATTSAGARWAVCGRQSARCAFFRHSPRRMVQSSVPIHVAVETGLIVTAFDVQLRLQNVAQVVDQRATNGSPVWRQLREYQRFTPLATIDNSCRHA